MDVRVKCLRRWRRALLVSGTGETCSRGPQALAGSPESTCSLCSGGTVTPFRVSLASPGSSAGLPGLLGYSEFLMLSACFYEQSRPSTNACRMNEWMNEWGKNDYKGLGQLHRELQYFTRRQILPHPFLLVQRCITSFQLAAFRMGKHKGWEVILKWRELNCFIVLPHYTRDYKGKV